MTLLDSLERRYGRFAIPGLLRIVAGLTALVFVLTKLNPNLAPMLDLDWSAILHGQLWRLITYLFIPQTGSLLPMPDWVNAAFYVFFLIWIGDGLEHTWGPFRLTIYFLLGMLGTTIAASFFGSSFSNLMLTASLFFAFARFYSDNVIYVAYILPAKIKWIAWGLAAWLLFGFLVGHASYRMALIAAFANYFLFFGPDLVRAARHRQEVAGRRQRFEASKRSEEASLHRCANCGATELTNPNLEFRVSRDGEEYCLAHLPSLQRVDA